MMNELLQGQLQKIVLGVLTSLLTVIGPCAATGCLRVKSIGVASDPPVMELKLPGADLILRPVSVEFYDGDESDETAENPTAGE